MSALALHLGISIVFLGISLYLAWEKRSWPQARILCLLLGVFWFPGVTLYTLVFGKVGESWEGLVISMTWLASLLVLGLCLMWSKKIHAHGRWMIILTLTAIAMLLGMLALCQ